MNPQLFYTEYDAVFQDAALLFPSDNLIEIRALFTAKKHELLNNNPFPPT